MDLVYNFISHRIITHSFPAQATTQTYPYLVGRKNVLREGVGAPNALAPRQVSILCVRSSPMSGLRQKLVIYYIIRSY
jgi:hypothetical protein